MAHFFRIQLPLILTACAGSLLAQESYTPVSEPVNITFHYNIKWELTSPENSFYKREAYFDLREMVFDGIYKDFNKDGKLVAEGFYQHGVKAGLESDYYEDQSIKTTIEFSNNDFTIWQKVTQDKKFEVAKGTGKFSIGFFYFFDLRVKQGILKGEFVNGKKIGIWTYKDTAGNPTDTEYYEDGKLLRHVVYRKADSVAVNYRKEILLSLSSITTQSFVCDKTVFAPVNDYFEKNVPYPESFNRPITFV
jgi:hypothetical protein